MRKLGSDSTFPVAQRPKSWQSLLTLAQRLLALQICFSIEGTRFHIRDALIFTRMKKQTVCRNVILQESKDEKKTNNKTKTK